MAERKPSNSALHFKRGTATHRVAKGRHGNEARHMAPHTPIWVLIGRAGIVDFLQARSEEQSETRAKESIWLLLKVLAGTQTKQRPCLWIMIK